MLEMMKVVLDLDCLVVFIGGGGLLVGMVVVVCVIKLEIEIVGV